MYVSVPFQECSPKLLLVRESEVQSLTSIILRGIQVVVLLCNAHTVPNRLPCLVPPHVVALDEESEYDVHRDNANKSLVALSVVWCIIRLVDL